MPWNPRIILDAWDGAWCCGSWRAESARRDGGSGVHRDRVLTLRRAAAVSHRRRPASVKGGGDRAAYTPRRRFANQLVMYLAAEFIGDRTTAGILD